MTGFFHRIRPPASAAIPDPTGTPAGPDDPTPSAPASTAREGMPGMPVARAGNPPERTAARRRVAKVNDGLKTMLSGVFARAGAKVERPLQDPMGPLPAEIAIQVLRHLDTRSIADVRRVSPRWSALGAAAMTGVRVASPAALARFTKAGAPTQDKASLTESFLAGGLERLELGSGKYTRQDLEQLPVPLRRKLKTLKVGHGAQLTEDAWALLAELPELESLHLGRDAVPDEAVMASLNEWPRLKGITAHLRSPANFAAIAASTKPLELHVDGRKRGVLGDIEFRDEDLARLPPSTTALTVARPLPNVTRQGWAALDELPRLRSLRAAACSPEEVQALSSCSKLTALDIAFDAELSSTQMHGIHFADLPDSVQELVFHGWQPHLDAEFWHSLNRRAGLRSVRAVARTPADLRPLSHCKKLTSLDVDCVDNTGLITDRTLRVLPRSLEELRFRRVLPAVGSGAWIEMNQRPALRRLDIVATDIDQMRELKASTKITGLDFTQMRWMDAYGDSDLARLPRSLRRLSLGPTSGSIDPKKVARLRASLPELEQVDIESELSGLDRALQAFGPSGILTGLKVTVPMGATLRPESFSNLPSSLRRLQVEAPSIGNSIDPAAIAELHALPLEHLDLCGIDLGDEAVRALVRHPTLQKLTAEQAGLGDAQAALLASSPSLRELDVTHNEIGEEGLRSLLSNGNLQRLNARLTAGINARTLAHYADDHPAHLDQLSLRD